MYDLTSFIRYLWCNCNWSELKEKVNLCSWCWCSFTQNKFLKQFSQFCCYWRDRVTNSRVVLLRTFVFVHNIFCVAFLLVSCSTTVRDWLWSSSWCVWLSDVLFEGGSLMAFCLFNIEFGGWSVSLWRLQLSLNMLQLSWKSHCFRRESCFVFWNICDHVFCYGL